jgi:hypothetical protein
VDEKFHSSPNPPSCWTIVLQSCGSFDVRQYLQKMSVVHIFIQKPRPYRPGFQPKLKVWSILAFPVTMRRYGAGEQ